MIFKDMLASLGVTEAQARAISEITVDLIPFDCDYSVKVAPSSIEGQGLFANIPFEAEDVICPSRINGHRTPAGRYTNHSDWPNSKMVMLGPDIYLKALIYIPSQEELTVDYREVISMRAKAGDLI